MNNLLFLNEKCCTINKVMLICKKIYKEDLTMAMNPMKRKAQNSFLLGILVTLLITGIIIAFLFMQLTKTSKSLKDLQANMVKVCTLNTSVKSGQIITDDMIEVKQIDKNVIHIDE